MDWQQLIALIIVATTAGIFVWRKLRPRPSPLGRDGHCGCAGGSQPADKSSIVFHTRKGERPRIIVKPK
jgi:hypothetical protein